MVRLTILEYELQLLQSSKICSATFSVILPSHPHPGLLEESQKQKKKWKGSEQNEEACVFCFLLYVFIMIYL